MSNHNPYAPGSINEPSPTVSREEYERETALAWGEVSALRKELAEQKQAMTNQAASLLRGVALAPCWECARLRDQVMEQTRRAEAAIYMLNAPKAALEMCGIFEEHDKERKAQLEQAQKRLAECEPVIEAVRDAGAKYRATLNLMAPRGTMRRYRKAVDLLFVMPLPEKRTP